ncbi:flagellar hook-basal body complex protein [bacterium]|nr:flagellar hook-basal body complex protein [bacterium]
MAGSAFFTAASGLRNHQLRIDVVANNIANVNTTGYKGQSVIFSDVLSQTLRGASAPTGELGGINPKQIGLGMQIAAIHNIMQQSALENTARQTDFAINGAGFFILTDGQENVYTRAGDFNVDRDGLLLSGDGLRVQGYNRLNAEGTEIDPGQGIGDIVINFGKKLEARPSTWLTYASNLNSASFRYGSANNETASVGTTGILTFAGAAEPWATLVGDPVDDDPLNYPILGGSETLDINGQILTLPPVGINANDAQEYAQIVADMINFDSILSAQVQATVVENDGNYQVVIQGVSPGTTFTIDASLAPLTGLPGTSTLVEPAEEPSSALVGNNTITVTDAKAATDTTSVPVGTGATNAPATGDTLYINGVQVVLAETYAATNTAAQNAVILANEINNTQDISVIATANPNGTITLAHAYLGQQQQADYTLRAAPNVIAGYEEVDIYIDDSVSGGVIASRWGLTSLDGWDAVNSVATIDNGVNAMAELVFTPEDGSQALTRFYEDWAYVPTIPPTLFASPADGSPAQNYQSSDLGNVESAIEGASASFPLMPGVNISIDELSAGQANFRTEDAYTHTTSQLVYDTLGNAHNLTTTFTHVNENEWDYEISLPEEPNILLANTTGRLEFSTDGLLTSGNPVLDVVFTAPGASESSVELIFDGNGNALNGITQFAAATTTAAREQDGYAMGVLTDFEADASGTIIAYYDNGQRRPIAQLALATFNNPEGLDRIGSTTFRSTTNSGAAVRLQPGTGGAGAVFNGYIEQSNVDLALEFTSMIITQRGLQANGRVFTTQDEILNEIVNLKR